MRTWKQAVWFAVLGLAGCPGGGPPPQTVEAPFSSLGEVADAVSAAQASEVIDDKRDSDGDGLPDVVEAELGSDPLNRDTDRDGLIDGYELFGTEYDPEEPLPDLDRDGVVAPLDADDDGDFVNDGEKNDTDGDEVPNYLEYYGYTYDFLTGRFRIWNGDESVPHWFTDPLQPSTDQDAFPDGTEASGALLDPTVAAPGDDPLVPAYPNLVFELIGYKVALNEEIEITEGEEVERGREWSRGSEQSFSRTDQSNWGVGAEVAYGVKDGVAGKVSANYGETYANTNTTSTTVASGESIMSGESWSRARSVNPSDAARLKLLVKVRNVGTSPVSRLVPTLTLKIGGLNVATFEPGNAPIDMLVPGAVYPAETGIFWVVDSIAGGGPLSLTMEALRALERGAPVTISLTQYTGEAMRLAPGGVWQSIGSISEYVARCDAVCANIRIDLGDGEILHRLVYADDAPSAPAMTLGDALTKLGVDGTGTLVYFDEDGIPRVRSLDGFTYAFDDDTLRANQWSLAGDGDPETAPPEETLLRDLRLFPFSSVYIRAPRDPVANGGPTIHFAHFDPETGEVRICASDYAGIATVAVSNEDRSSTKLLIEDFPGAGFYSGFVGEEEGFDGNDQLIAEVTNLSGDSAEETLGSLFVAPGPQQPVISTVSLDTANHYLYANVESGHPTDPVSDIAWVKVFHPGLTATGGVLELAPVVNSFEDPNGWSVELPSNFTSTNVRVVAFVTEGVYTVDEVTADEVIDPYRKGTAFLHAENKKVLGVVSLFIHAALPTPFWTWWVPTVDLDAVNDGGVVGRPKSTHLELLQPADPAAAIDFWLRVDRPFPKDRAYLRFHASYTKMPDGTDFGTLTKPDLVEAQPGDTGALEVDADDGIREGTVLAMKTSSNRYAKLLVTRIEYSYSWARLSRSAKVWVQYVVYK